MSSIAKDFRADVARIEQKRAYYCGPACCQMFLGRYNVACDQSDAYEKIQASNKESEFYYSDPHGIASFLNSAEKQFTPNDISPFTTKNFQDLLDRLFYTLDFLKFPCITLTQSGAHWVVIDGFRAMVSSDGVTQSLGVYVENPWYNEVPDYYSSIDDMSSTLILPNKYGEKWKDQFVILSDDSKSQLKPVVPFPVAAKAGGAVSADPDDAALLAVSLHGFESVRPISSGGGAPVLQTMEITGLDGWNDYYLVPLDATKTPQFKDFVYAAIDKVSGKLLQIATLSKALQIYSANELQRDISYKFPKSKITILPGYFWKPSNELRSRFNVVRKFMLDSQQKIMCPSGKIIDTLTNLDHGA